MKIVYVIARFYPFKGGAEANCYELAVRSAQAGHEVIVLTTDARPGMQPLPKEETHRGVKIVRLHRLNQQLNLGFYPGLLPALWRTHADVIHICNGPGFVWHELCLWLVRIFQRRSKTVITPHGPFLATPQTHKGMRRHLAYLGKMLLAPYFKFAWARLFDVVIATNAKQPLWLRRDYGVPQRKIAIVPNGIDKKIIPKVLPPKASAPINITFIGRMEAYKGVGYVLSALKNILDHDPEADFSFTVMGHPGNGLPLWQKFVREHNLQPYVRFVIDPADEERDLLLAQSHIHILPSEWEGTGIVLIEAMAKGNAIITTRQNEAWDMLVSEGENGYSYDYWDQERLAIILQSLIENDDLRSRMITLNWHKAQNFTWEAIYPDYAHILTKLTARP